MSEFTERLLTNSPRKDANERFRIIWLIIVPLVAILFQVYVPRYLAFLSYLELPLLITVHFALSRRAPIAAVFYGMFFGLAHVSPDNHQRAIGLFLSAETTV